MEATNQETSEVTNSIRYELKNGENEGERVNPTIPIGTDVSESSSNAIVTATAISTIPLAKEGYANGASSSSSRVRLPPPFLLKVYDIVKNPETDSIISWSSSGTSFIVWDPHRFAAEVLGKYFRHNNFASFICQLNTYLQIKARKLEYQMNLPTSINIDGFRKINWDRLEFQNAWFQKGKKSWLKKIKRRIQGTQSAHLCKPLEIEGQLSLSVEQKKFESLMQEHDALKVEMMKLKDMEENLVKEIEILEKQAQCITSNRQNMLKYTIHEVLIRKRKLQSNDAANELGSGGRQSIESSVELLDEGGTSHGSRKNSPRAQSGTGKTFSNVDLSTTVQEEEDCTVSMGKFSDFYNAVYSSLEKQLMDDINCKNVPEEEKANLQQNVVIPLEDLIEGPADWNEFAKGIGTSLIVLDHLKFAAEVLPKYFKHSNFSSFIYQLNNYGFRKIGLRQYEYENNWFQRGQEHLLMHIRRRNDEDPTIMKKRGPKKQHVTAARPSMEAELKIFEDHINALKEDITRSKYHMGKLESSIATFKKNVKIMEAKSKVLIKVLARIFNPALVEKIIQHVEEEPELEILQTMKRRRVILPQSSNTTTKSTDNGACGKDQDDQEANTSIVE
ncbi:unnamed protein product [Coffea canephora]|uniref:HSF-type DNA-binding domain-containing protein n=1 Tax=Coffea canephora TaxID=49390 RepID=A0A068TWB8_COFCA|nr:unnamed protein product [Coffea canephora]